MEDSKKTQLHRGKGQSQKAVTKERKRLNQYIGLARVHDRFLSKTIYKNVLFVSSIGWKDYKKKQKGKYYTRQTIMDIVCFCVSFI